MSPIRASSPHVIRLLIVMSLLLAGFGSAIAPATSTSADQALWLYVTNTTTNAVTRANTDGSGGVSLGNLDGTLSGPYGIALDPIGGKMYVTNWSSHTISRANLDGSDGENLGNLNGTLNGPCGIALDLDAGKMYVVNQFVGYYPEGTVSRANLDGTGGENLGNLNNTTSWPCGIALDLTEGKMYVTNQLTNSVSRANLDGSGGESLGNLNGTLYYPAGIALDLDAGKMYVVNQFDSDTGNFPGTISRADLDGTNGENLGALSDTLTGPYGIALDLEASKMYVADPYGDAISEANLDGTEGVSLGNPNDTLSGPYGIALGIATEPPTEEVEIALQAGWNMVSVPVVADDMSRDAVFPGVAAVYTWNPLTKSYSVPTTIEPEKGYWVAATVEDTITVTGEPVEDWTQDVALGWNMIGSTYGDALATSYLTTETTPDPLQRTAIYSWNPDTKSYQGVSDITQGWGYWLASAADCTATLAPSEP